MVYESRKNITTIDGHNITLRIFSPTNEDYQASKCNGVILAVHGLGEYSDRYKHLSEITCRHNKIFAIYDVRGHGENAEKKGDVQNFSSLILDIIDCFETLKKLFSHLPEDSFALFGHSFGGVQATYAASVLQTRLKKLFLSAPGYASKVPVAPWKIILANNVVQFFPELMIPIGFNTDDISNNPENNKAYKNDELILKKVSARFGLILLGSLNESNLTNAVEKIAAKVTLLIPNDDKIIDSNFTKQMSKLFQNLDKVCEIDKAGHESFNETTDVQNEAFATYENWLKN